MSVPIALMPPYQAPVFCRRRHQPRSPPLASIRPQRVAGFFYCFRGRSNKQCEQSNHANSDNQHCECYGIVVQPMSLLLHRAPTQSYPSPPVFGKTPKSRTASGWGALLTGCSPRHMPLAAITAAPCAMTMSVNAKPPEDSHSLIVENFIACPISNARIYGSLGKSQNASHCSTGSCLL